MDDGDLSSRLARLSPAKRALLELKLSQRGSQNIRHATISRRAACESAPLSFAQQRLWFLNQLEPESSAYNEAMAIRLEGALDIFALKNALNTIVERHEILRTSIVMDSDGGPVQVAGQSRSVDLPVLDLSEQSESDVQRTIGEIKNRPFNLGQDLMLRAALLRTGTAEHILVVVKHHIASDGWSSGVFSTELATLYRAYCQGQPNPLPPLSIQYADYAVWQRQWLRGDELEKQISFWKEQLRDLPMLELPTDRPRPPIQTHRGARRSLVLPRSLSEQLTGLSHQENATLFMTLLAAFQILLHRYSGQDDIAVGSPIAGRTRLETEGLIGFFVNTLVLRTDLSSNPTFKEVLARVRDVALKAYEHQDLPFEKIVEELNPERDRSRSPLFQVTFAVQNVPRRRLELPGLIATPVEIDLATAKFDLSAAFVERNGQQTLRIEYNTDLFDDATISRLLGHFHALLEGIVSHPEQRISDLPILSESERRQLLLEWSDTREDYPKDRCLHQLFEGQATQTPDAVAVVFEDQQLTYRELNQCANGLARSLRELGVRPNVLVGLCVDRSAELIIGILGILKAGGAYVPFDSSHPKDRLEFMLNDSDVSVMLTQRHLASNLPAHRSAIVYLDAEQLKNSSGGLRDAELEIGAKPDNLAYVIYTSGSTGKPKGVLITHYNVVRLFQSTQAWFNFNSSDVWTLFHSFAFDFSVWEMWGALLNGGRLVVVPHDVSRSPEEFAALVKQNGVTLLNQTPSAFRQLMPCLISTLAPAQSALRYVIFGGEALELQSLQPWFDCYGDERTQLINMYGITETTVHVTYRPIRQADIKSKVGSVVGRPIPDLKVYVLGAHQQLQPVGIPGEIYVGGAGVANGYLHRPELTAERFIADPFSGDPQARLYRSGDLARWLPNGELEYLGRIDDQVKIRGYRIELGEIGAALNHCAQVREAMVIAREDTPGDKRLVAYIVADDELAMEELRSRLSAVLPDYMVPSAFVRLHSFPLTANGKIDCRALPAPNGSRPDLTEAYAAPRSPIEELLAEIWQEVLKLEKVGIHDNFFNLGGHSLLATRVMSRMRETLRKNIPLRQLFEAPTISELARLIDHSRAHPDGKQAPPIMRASRQSYKVRPQQ